MQRKVVTLLALTFAVSFAAQANVDATTIAARTKFFGADNVDQRTGAVNPDRVIISWITNASFAVAAKGHVMLLDTFVTRLEQTAGRTPFTVDDLVALQPEAIFLGHGHFDHADNAAYIAAKTSAPIYASPETCEIMAKDATNNFNNGYTDVNAVACVGVTSRGSLPGAEMVRIPQFEPQLEIEAFRHLHSTNTGAPDPAAVPIAASANGVCSPTTAKGNTFPCNVADPRDAQLFPKGIAEPRKIGTVRTANAGGPVAIFYVFTIHEPNRFRFVWHNSTGDIVDSCALPNVDGAGNPFEPPQQANGCFLQTTTVNNKTVGANLADIMDSLRPVDVQIGSVVSLGFNQNGERDTISYIAHLRPKVFIPNHVTAVAVESSSLEWRAGYFAELAVKTAVDNGKGATYTPLPPSQWPETIWLVDPNDYLRPIVFNPSDERWRQHGEN